MSDLDQLCVNTLRFLAVDAVEKANSGHPGLPLGAAPMAYVLWSRFLRHNPLNPAWPNRDRFVLSPGHGCALLYALLNLTGYDLPLEELKRFRQWGSKTPGHPEYGLTSGVEATTGPLGQGFAMGVGMALAEAHLSACFNRPGFRLVDHYTYGIVSDGDLMEGVASEAASLAGALCLGKLIYLYDNNHISIEGKTDNVFTESVQHRFEAYGWQVLTVDDGTDLEAIENVIRAAHADTKRPSLIAVGNHIGYGSPKQDTAAAHGEPLGAANVKATKQRLGWPLNPAFLVPDAASAHFLEGVAKGKLLEQEWRTVLQEYAEEHSSLAHQYEQVMRGELPARWDSDLPVFRPEDGPMATRDASGKVMNALAQRLLQLMGGSADLAPSTKTILVGYGDFGFGKDCGRNLHFGVREHAMGAIVNGLALHGGIMPYSATFLTFSDYMRPALRMAAMMQTNTTFIFTHDSIGLGEDGPTHQPVEQLLSLRAIPGLVLIRPADANETAAAWRIAVTQRGPVALALSRQKLPILDSQRYPIEQGVAHGAYVLAEAEGRQPDVILIGTGSEVHLILRAQEELLRRGVRARVVSMPSWELFDQQPVDYRARVLPQGVPKLAVEAGVTRGWRDYVGDSGDIIGLDRFGASAPGAVVMEKLGFNVEHVVARATGLVRRRRESAA
ncbi:MAG: transketolase [Candidatus Sulfotelmatobacter sp.]